MAGIVVDSVQGAGIAGDDHRWAYPTVTVGTVIQILAVSTTDGYAFSKQRFRSG